jgi:hypothetical protein
MPQTSWATYFYENWFQTAAIEGRYSKEQADCRRSNSRLLCFSFPFYPAITNLPSD